MVRFVSPQEEVLRQQAVAVVFSRFQVSTVGGGEGWDELIIARNPKNSERDACPRPGWR